MAPRSGGGDDGGAGVALLGPLRGVLSKAGTEPVTRFHKVQQNRARDGAQGPPGDGVDLDLTHSDVELRRLCALGHLDILDTPAEPSFEHVARAASDALGAAMTAIAFVDYRRVWFKACVGAPVTHVPRDTSFCHDTVSAGGVHIVPDAACDHRYCSNPLVVGPPYARTYAGAALEVGPELNVGAFCVLYAQPTVFTAAMRKQLEAYRAMTLELIHQRYADNGRSHFVDRLTR